MQEFELINTFFAKQKIQREDVIKGIGDDAALVRAEHRPLHFRLAILSGNHYLEDRQQLSRDISNRLSCIVSEYKLLDIVPCWLTLAITLPQGDPDLTREISNTLKNISASYNIQIIGGDTTHGPFALVMQLTGTGKAE